jgi:hypothetical protein
MIEARIQSPRIQKHGAATARPAIAGSRPSVPAAVQAGLVAGTTVLVLMQLIAITIYDESAWKLPRMMAALVRGPGVLEPDDEFDAGIVAIGLVLHFALAVLYALALSCLVADTPRRHATLLGLATGIALYFANFHGFTAIFPWFAPHRTIDTFVVHALFGVLVANGYWVFRGTPSR